MKCVYNEEFFFLRARGGGGEGGAENLSQYYGKTKQEHNYYRNYVKTKRKFDILTLFFFTSEGAKRGGAQSIISGEEACVPQEQLVLHIRSHRAVRELVVGERGQRDRKRVSWRRRSPPRSAQQAGAIRRDCGRFYVRLRPPPLNISIYKSCVSFRVVEGS